MTVPPLKATDSAGAMPLFAASAVRTFARTATFMPMNPVIPDSTAPITNPIATFTPRSPVQMAGHGDRDRHRHGHACDGRVLAAQIGRRPLLDRRGNLAHAVGSLRLRQHPSGQSEPVYNRRGATHERDQDGMVNQ